MENDPLNNLFLRDVVDDDLPIFFEYQLDPDANFMAAFTAKDPSNREAFAAHWAKIMADTTVILKTIIYDKQVVGSVLSYEDAGKPEVSYWIGKPYWGKGIATRALSEFLAQVNTKRPIHARVAKDNLGSRRVLEKCGFKIVGESKGFANARGEEIEELLLELQTNGRDEGRYLYAEESPMQFNFQLMDEAYAHAIANWHYEGIYAFYDMDQDAEDLEELLNPHSWPDHYYAVVDEGNELIGFFSFHEEERGVVTIGLGLRPDHTGKGLGQAFIEAGLDFAKETFAPSTFRLNVATFNQRAIRVYERLGFQPDAVFMHATNGGRHEFLRMEREAVIPARA